MPPRLYTGLDDLTKIQNLLRAGLRTYPYSYPHPGDVEWWIFYNPLGDVPEESLYLWEDEAGDLLGWVFYLTKYCEYDLFIHPALRGAPLEEEMIVFAETRLHPHLTRENPSIEMGNIFADHTSLQTTLQRHDYTLKEYLVYFQQDLSDDLPLPVLPEGFHFLPEMRLEYADLRADVHLGAFTPSRMTGAYYRDVMMQAPMYQPDADVVVIAPDGTFAAFAMTWPDPILQRGEFEPVGTRTAWQRRGLGRAAMLEGLRRLRSRGMTQATLCTGAHQPGNIAFYQACGFHEVNRVLRGTKDIPWPEGQG